MNQLRHFNFSRGPIFIGFFTPRTTHCCWLIVKDRFNQLRPWVDGVTHGLFILRP